MKDIEEVIENYKKSDAFQELSDKQKEFCLKQLKEYVKDDSVDNVYIDSRHEGDLNDEDDLDIDQVL